MIEPRMYVKKCFADLIVKYGSIFGKDKTMTDKQMIIDGIDVNGCTHKKNDACMAITDLSGDFCHYCDEEIMKDCYYKQLKRAENQIVELNKKVEAKEQECEKWKKYGSFYLDKFIQFKQTLTEIKEIAKNGCYDDCGMPLDELSIILQKINECEGNDEN